MKIKLKLFFYIIAATFLGNSIVSAAEMNFVSDLKSGSTGNEVLWLQQALNTDPETSVASSGVGSLGNETSYFGSMTENAVIRFQNKHASEILSPLGLYSGTGIVGSMTRAVLNRLYGGMMSSVVTQDVVQTDSSVPPAPTYPTITAVKPGAVSDPRYIPVTIEGSNFAPMNKVFLSIQNLEIFEAPSYDGRTISLLLNTEVIDGVKELVDSVAGSAPSPERTAAINSLKTEFNSIGLDGVYVPAIMFVQNGVGESNKFEIRINVLKDEL